MQVIFDRSEQQIPIFSWCVAPDDKTREQALNLANHPVIVRQVGLMPDGHGGYGMPIGGVIACKNAIIPNAVGKDIGCGMFSFMTNLRADAIPKSQYRLIRQALEKRIPHGSGKVHKDPQRWLGFEAWVGMHGVRAAREWAIKDPFEQWNWYKRSLGTLGGGNHFIELQVDESGYLWCTIHSGSRNLGSNICDHFHKKAVELNTKWKSAIPHKDLAFLPVDSDEGQEYFDAMDFALTFAQENRRRMADVVKDILDNEFADISFLTEINIHHNYAAREHHYNENLWIHRKGATAANEGQLGVIPGSQGDPTYIVRGKGNPLSFKSCSHGAGRTMSRTSASLSLSLEEANQDMIGIEFKGFGTTKIKGKRVVDLSEAPDAYKDIDDVMDAQKDLVKIEYKLLPRMSFKE